MPWQRQTQPPESEPGDGPDDHLELARESLQQLVKDERIPESVRVSLAADYQQVETMLEKLEQGHIHIAAFGRVSVGKSATLNALLGEDRFVTSPLHGETKESQMGRWPEYQSGGVFFIDTPGINEVAGEARERLAHEVAARSDLVLFVVDGDLTESELRTLRILADQDRPILLLLNKSDRYTTAELEKLRGSLLEHAEGLVAPENILQISAAPPQQRVIVVDASGYEREAIRQPAADVDLLKERLWSILEAEGKTLAALNASLFAGNLSQQIGQKVLETKRHIGAQLIHTYCISKGVAVAFNPIPVADILAAAVMDVSLVIHLSKLFGLPLSKSEASGLVKTIMAQMLLLMGTVWAVHFVSSALKLGTGGISAVVTGGAQGAVAYFSTRVVGQAAEHYLAQGKSWGEGGPKYVVREILDSLDRDSILKGARSDIRQRLKSVL
ncbi:MAG: DUF697 domain-containing protein [Gammaproteobacteria bacterium]|nr:DUF697 domain-containing protein [Gammaproteobacteria bacterium]